MSEEYQNAGDWVGVVFAVQAIGSVLWALVIPRFSNKKTAYVVSLLIGAIGFIGLYFVNDQYINLSFIDNKYVLFLPFMMIGCAWAAMLALPFTILTNALKGGHLGTYLGLFNGTICIPQIVAAALGGTILSLFPMMPGKGVAPEINMLVLSGALLIAGALSVSFIKEHEK